MALVTVFPRPPSQNHSCASKGQLNSFSVPKYIRQCVAPLGVLLLLFQPYPAARSRSRGLASGLSAVVATATAWCGACAEVPPKAAGRDEAGRAGLWLLQWKARLWTLWSLALHSSLQYRQKRMGKRQNPLYGAAFAFYYFSLMYSVIIIILSAFYSCFYNFGHS